MIRILCPHGAAILPLPLAQQEDESRFLSGFQFQAFFQGTAVIAALFEASAHLAAFHRRRIILGAVEADEFVPQTVETIRIKI